MSIHPSVSTSELVLADRDLPKMASADKPNRVMPSTDTRSVELIPALPLGAAARTFRTIAPTLSIRRILFIRSKNFDILKK
jgi:hypothetical protein